MSYHFILISDESNKSNRTGKGPYSVTITLTSDSSEVSNCVTSGKQGLLPLHKGTGNYETPTGRNVLGETNRDCCGYQSITRGTNGFSLKRFLPREVTGESTNAYLLTRSSSRAIESGNTLGFNALGLRYVFFLKYWFKNHQSITCSGPGGVQLRVHNLTWTRTESSTSDNVLK